MLMRELEEDGVNVLSRLSRSMNIFQSKSKSIGPFINKPLVLVSTSCFLTKPVEKLFRGPRVHKRGDS